MLIRENFIGNTPKRFHIAGNFLRIKSVSGVVEESVSVAFFKDGQQLYGELSTADPGDKIFVPDGFDLFEVTSTVSQLVALQVMRGEVDSTRITGSMTFSDNRILVQTNDLFGFLVPINIRTLFISGCGPGGGGGGGHTANPGGGGGGGSTGFSFRRFPLLVVPGELLDFELGLSGPGGVAGAPGGGGSISTIASPSTTNPWLRLFLFRVPGGLGGAAGTAANGGAGAAVDGGAPAGGAGGAGAGGNGAITVVTSTHGDAWFGAVASGGGGGGPSASGGRGGSGFTGGAVPLTNYFGGFGGVNTGAAGGGGGGASSANGYGGVGGTGGTADGSHAEPGFGGGGGGGGALGSGGVGGPSFFLIEW